MFCEKFMARSRTLFLPRNGWENRRLFVKFCVCWGGSANRDTHFNEKRVTGTNEIRLSGKPTYTFKIFGQLGAGGSFRIDDDSPRTLSFASQNAVSRSMLDLE